MSNLDYCEDIISSRGCNQRRFYMWNQHMSLKKFCAISVHKNAAKKPKLRFWFWKKLPHDNTLYCTCDISWPTYLTYQLDLPSKKHFLQFILYLGHFHNSCDVFSFVRILHFLKGNIYQDQLVISAWKNDRSWFVFVFVLLSFFCPFALFCHFCKDINLGWTGDRKASERKSGQELICENGSGGSWARRQQTKCCFQYF